jgi:hypothetical protein
MVLPVVWQEDLIRIEITTLVAEQLGLVPDEVNYESSFSVLGVDGGDFWEVLFAMKKRELPVSELLFKNKACAAGNFPRPFGPQSTVADLRQLVVG